MLAVRITRDASLRIVATRNHRHQKAHRSICKKPVRCAMPKHSQSLFCKTSSGSAALAFIEDITCLEFERELTEICRCHETRTIKPSQMPSDLHALSSDLHTVRFAHWGVLVYSRGPWCFATTRSLIATGHAITCEVNSQNAFARA